MSEDVLIKGVNIQKTFFSGNVKTEVIRGIDIEIKKEDYVVIFGPSGAGKTTLLHIIAGLLSPTKGKVLWKGEDIYSMSEERRSLWRRENIGFIFQFFHLLPDLTLEENVLIAGWKKWGKREAKRRAEELLEKLGLKRIAHRYPAQVSGGEKQRTAIARALINEPSLILADEPTGNVDSATGEEIRCLLEKLREEKGTALAVATHREDWKESAGKIFFLEDGKIIKRKNKEEENGQN